MSPDVERTMHFQSNRKKHVVERLKEFGLDITGVPRYESVGKLLQRNVGKVRVVHGRPFLIDRRGALEPHVRVWKPKDETGQAQVFEVLATQDINASADTVYSILANHENSKNVFRSIAGAKIEHKDGKKLLHQRQRWKCMMFNGTFLSQLWVNEDPVKRSITFDLARPGFMQDFNGMFQVEPVGPGVGDKHAGSTSRLTLKQRARPSIAAPGPAGFYVQHILTSLVHETMNDIQTYTDAFVKNLNQSKGKEHS
ncbi:hypothetical protein KFL_001870030 [Klebsormidium nitens]|uniref:Uncharacterized protein n=1 Tax=Klebsormidium nitens TaxID=105231 RepID=A0A1Y1I5E0_KLENI|nr:hypothetical protein KFL_001870030 [Klebsormidium nitens]|eukprot:GAQ84381.1 hypothetical protein KFL_001870030 [Klebsormidium nitens]